VKVKAVTRLRRHGDGATPAHRYAPTTQHAACSAFSTT
jgi:hypothetical protein